MSAATLYPTQHTVTPGSKKSQVIELLKSGCKPSEVAAAVGCDPSYVSQILDPNTPEGVEIALHRIKLLKDSTERDGKYDSLEDRLLEGLELKLAQGVAFLKVETILRAIQTINNAKRRGAGNTGETGNVNNVVNLIAPQIIMKHYQVNQVNEVISVGDKELISMSQSDILAKIQDKTKTVSTLVVEKKEETHEQSQQQQPNKVIPATRTFDPTISESSRRIKEATAITAGDF